MKDEYDQTFIDIQDKKKVYLQKTQIEYIENNPEGLTKEGCKEHLANWELSHNKYMKAMYRIMLKKCEKFTTSGKTVDSRIILSRGEDGKITWVGEPEKEE